MPAFDYVAMDAVGAERRGVLEAADGRRAAERLRGERLHVLRLVERAAGAELRPRRALWRRRPSSAAREAFYRQVAVLLGSGLTLVQALETCCGKSAPPSTRRVAAKLVASVRDGNSFSASMAAQPGMLAGGGAERLGSAELVGELDRALLGLADELERQRRVRAKLQAALTYPAVILLVAAGVTALLVLFVVPRFAHFFAASGRPLPRSLSLLVRISELASVGVPLLLGVAAVLLLALWLLRRGERGRVASDRVVLALPGLGWLMSRHALWRATDSLSSLLEAGLPILQSLRLAARNSGNAAMEQVFDRAAERVLAGHEVAPALEHPLVPDDLRQVVAVGERSGELSRVLAHLASHYERQVDRTIARFATLSEPVLLVFVGVVVGGIYIAFFQAIFQVAGR